MTQQPLLALPKQPRNAAERTEAGLCVLVGCELPPTEKRGPYLLCGVHVVSWDRQK